MVFVDLEKDFLNAIVDSSDIVLGDQELDKKLFSFEAIAVSSFAVVCVGGEEDRGLRVIMEKQSFLFLGLHRDRPIRSVR